MPHRIDAVADRLPSKARLLGGLSKPGSSLGRWQDPKVSLFWVKGTKGRDPDVRLPEAGSVRPHSGTRVEHAYFDEDTMAGTSPQRITNSR